MPYTSGHAPNKSTTFDILTGAFEDVESTFYDVKYPELKWRDVVPESSVDTSINPGATNASYFVKDIRGKGAFRAQHDQGVPTVGQTLDKVLVPVEVAGVTANFDREDARQMSFGYNQSLLTDLSTIMRKACERHVEGVIFYGDDNVKGFESWLDYSSVTVTNAVNGGGGTSPWSTKTADEIIADINTGIETVWTGTKQVHLPDTLFLPGTQFALLASTKMSVNSDLTILEFLKKNNLYTSVTGQDLTIISIRYLDGAGAGAVDRIAVAELKNPENVRLPFPLPFDLLEPVNTGYDIDIYAEYKFGSFHLRYPASMLYVDGV